MALVLDGPNDKIGAGTVQTDKLLSTSGLDQITFNVDGTVSLSPKVTIGTNGNLLLTQVTDPSIPVAGFTKVWGKSIASRAFVSAMGSSGMDYPLQPSMWRQKAGLWNPPGNATTLPGVFAITAPTAQGTATLRNVATTNSATRMRRLGYVSAATAAALCGQYTTLAQFSTGDGAGNGGFFYSCRFVISDAANVAGSRMFVGMSSTVAAATNVEPTTLLNSFGVAQLSTDATQLYIVYGGSAAQTAIPLGTGFPPTFGSVIGYDITFFCPPSGNGVINYRLERLDTSVYVEGTITPATPGTQTPLYTTLLAHRAWRCNNATLLACGLDVCSIYIETDQ